MSASLRLRPSCYVAAIRPKGTDIEITQSRNLDVDRLTVRRSRTDPDARHDTQDGRRLGWRRPDLSLSALATW